MKIGSFLTRLLKVTSLLPLLAFGGSLTAHAQEDLPWQNEANTQGQYGGSNGRTYADPGEAYDPARHGSTPQNDRYQQGSGQGNTQGGYDSGYDALRNNNRANQDYQNQQAQPPQGQTGYDRNGRYQGQGRYDDRQPDYPRQGNANQGY